MTFAKYHPLKAVPTMFPTGGGATYIIIKGHVGGGWGAFN